MKRIHTEALNNLGINVEKYADTDTFPPVWGIKLSGRVSRVVEHTGVGNGGDRFYHVRTHSRARESLGHFKTQREAVAFVLRQMMKRSYR
jgi:hypothetical protein